MPCLIATLRWQHFLFKVRGFRPIPFAFRVVQNGKILGASKGASGSSRNIRNPPSKHSTPQKITAKTHQHFGKPPINHYINKPKQPLQDHPQNHQKNHPKPNAKGNRTKSRLKRQKHQEPLGCPNVTALVTEWAPWCFKFTAPNLTGLFGVSRRVFYR